MKRLFRFAGCLSLAVLALGVLPVAGQDAKLMSLAAPDCTYGGEIKSIEAVDMATVKFTLCYPDPAFTSKVVQDAFGIQSSDYLEKTGGKGDLLTNPIGTGPYKLEKWDRGNELDMTRFDDYWGEKAKAKTLVFRWNAEAAQRFTELQAGNIDVFDNPAPNDFATLQNNPDYQLLTRDGLNTLYLAMNNNFPPFDNVKVRQAVAYSIDKQRIVDNFFPPGSSVATQLLPEAMFGYSKEVTGNPLDAQKAMDLLDQAAKDDGVKLPIESTIKYRNVVRGYLPQPPVIAQDLQAQLNGLGGGKYFNISVEEVESGTFIAEATSGKYAMHLLGGGADYPDASNLFGFWFQGVQASYGKDYKDIEDAVAEGGRSTDNAARAAAYLKVNQLVQEEVPMVPIAHGGSAIVYKKGIEGAQASPLRREKFYVTKNPDSDTLVFMQGAEPIVLYCADNTDDETSRACVQMNESLTAFKIGSTEIEPSLAESWDVNTDGTEWTFHLRQGVKFHDGSSLDANDVVETYVVQWDASNPLHVGNGTGFPYWPSYFGAFLYAPKAAS
jgi:peptide/nickel transport system substrate-binding protein